MLLLDSQFACNSCRQRRGCTYCSMPFNGVLEHLVKQCSCLHSFIQIRGDVQMFSDVSYFFFSVSCTLLTYFWRYGSMTCFISIWHETRCEYHCKCQCLRSWRDLHRRHGKTLPGLRITIEWQRYAEMTVSQVPYGRSTPGYSSRPLYLSVLKGESPLSALCLLGQPQGHLWTQLNQIAFVQDVANQFLTE